MKSFFFTLFASIFIACQPLPKKDHVLLFGTVKNMVKPADKTLLTIARDRYQKKIKINKDGSFRDTLRLKDQKNITSFDENFYEISLGNHRFLAYLKNGFELELQIDQSRFEWLGKGAENSRYILEKTALNKTLMGFKEWMALPQKTFEKQLETTKRQNEELLKKHPALDPDFLAAEVAYNAAWIKSLEDEYQGSISIQKNRLSPQFKNYKNHAGGTNSLDDFRGKYVYLDLWATWCGPCLQQIPFVKQVEEKYRKKNIVFVGISIDDPRLEDKWKQVVEENEMPGVQLFANGDTSFLQAYQVNGIPRFILIDPEGKIVDANAPRPSDPSLTTLLDGLKM